MAQPVRWTGDEPEAGQNVNRPARTLDAFRDALIVFDMGLQVTDLNRAAEILFQVPRERAMDRLLIGVVRDHRIERLALEGGTLELDWTGRFLRVRGLRSGDGTGSLIFEDVSETRTRERELREVMAILSHEFRTPVTAVKGLLEALRLDPPAETQKRFLEMSLVEVERLVRLSEDLTVGFRPQAQRVVRSIVTAWQGETWGRYIQSDTGAGNEFGFTVPAVQVQPHSSNHDNGGLT